MGTKLVAAALCAALVAGCTSIPEPPELLVNTVPPGASCMLTRAGQPLASVGPTPGIVLVDPNAGAIAVACRRSGFADALVTLPVDQSGDREHRVDIALVPASR
jgi:hypothetical protein